MDNRNKTVTDLTTGLTWQQQDDDVKKEWIDADGYCQELKLGGNEDWRLPTINKLQSIVDYRNFDPAISLDFFPGTNDEFYWSGTPADWVSGWRLIVNFWEGHMTANNMVGSPAFVRCVR